MTTSRPRPYDSIPSGRCAELMEIYPELAMFSSSHLADDLSEIADVPAWAAWHLADMLPDGDELCLELNRRCLSLLWDAKNRAVMSKVIADRRMGG